MNTPRLAAFLLLAAATACARHKGDIAGLVIGTPPQFETRTELTTASMEHADYHVADLNGDGILDMAVISVTGEFRVLIGNGTSFLVTQQQQQIADAPIWISGGDFDGDGDRDLVVVRYDSTTVDTWMNDGNGTFTLGQALTVPMVRALSVVTGDLNNDGDIDIVVAVPRAPQIKVFFGDGTGSFPDTLELTLANGGVPNTVQIGDVTRDGLLDLVAADPILSRVVVFPGTPGGTGFGNDYCELQIPGSPGAVAIGDLSGDGLPDMCVSAFDLNRYVVVTEILPPVGKGGGDGQDGASGGSVCDYLSFLVNVPDKPSLAAIGDVTGDGLADLIACLAFRSSVLVAPQLPGGGISDDDTTKSLYDASGIPLRPFVGDLDGNGKNDMCALSGGGSRINVWRANTQGRLLSARNFDSGLPGSTWMVGGDFDGDGDKEVIVGSDQEPNLSVLGQAPGASLLLETTFDAGAAVLQLESSDLDLDGRPDLIISVAGGLRVLRNTSSPGSYSFALPVGTPAVLGTGAMPFGSTTGDFDRDGNMDIAFCDLDGGGLHILRGSGQPFLFLPEVIVELDGQPLDVVAADFTGDGLVDLAVSRQGMSDIALLRNVTPPNGLPLGAPGFEQFLALPVGQSPNYLITADFNRDGRSDLVVSNGASGSVTVLYGSPIGFIGQEFDAGSGPTALMAADLTGDDLPDILVASLISGDFRVMVGDGQGGFPQLPSFPGTWGASNALLQDMTSDGLPDLLISSFITERVSLVRNIRD